MGIGFGIPKARTEFHYRVMDRRFQNFPMDDQILLTSFIPLPVNGSFTYNYGVSSQATSVSATVQIFNNNATFVSKNAYTSGNTATATATVRYAAAITTKSTSVSCDKYGNLY